MNNTESGRSLDSVNAKRQEQENKKIGLHTTLKAWLQDFVSPQENQDKPQVPFFKKTDSGRTVLTSAGKTALRDRVFENKGTSQSGRRKRYSEESLGLKDLCGADNQKVQEAIEQTRKKIAYDHSLTKDQRHQLKIALKYLEKVNLYDEKGAEGIKARIKEEWNLIIDRRFEGFLNQVSPEEKQRLFNLFPGIKFEGETSVSLPDKISRFRNGLTEASGISDKKTKQAALGKLNLQKARFIGNLTKLILKGEAQGILNSDTIEKLKAFYSKTPISRSSTSRFPGPEESNTAPEKRFRRIMPSIEKRRNTLLGRIRNRIARLFPFSSEAQERHTKSLLSGKRKLAIGLLAAFEGFAIGLGIAGSLYARPITGEAARGPLPIRTPISTLGQKQEDQTGSQKVEITSEKQKNTAEDNLSQKDIFLINQAYEKMTEAWKSKGEGYADAMATIEPLFLGENSIFEQFVLDVGGQKTTPPFYENRLYSAANTPEAIKIKQAFIDKHKTFIYYNNPNHDIDLARLTTNFIDNGYSRLQAETIITSTLQADIMKTIFDFGKATPEDMQVEINKRLEAQGIQEFSSKEQAKQWLIDEGIGIDCAGMVAVILEKYYQDILGKSFYETTGTSWGNIGPGTFTELVERDSAREIENKVSELQPGDVIVLGDYHSLMFAGFYPNEKTGKLMGYLLESTDVAFEENGPHIITFEVTNPEESLSRQKFSHRQSGQGLFDGAIFSDLDEEQAEAYTNANISYGARFESTDPEFRLGIYRFKEIAEHYEAIRGELAKNQVKVKFLEPTFNGEPIEMPEYLPPWQKGGKGSTLRPPEARPPSRPPTFQDRFRTRIRTG